MAPEARWKQRFDNLERAYARLDEACRRDGYSDLERAGLVHTFIFTFELVWKVLRDLLVQQGYDVNSPRRAIRIGYEAAYIGEDECEVLLKALNNRNILSHVYRSDIALEVERIIVDTYHPAFRRVMASILERVAVDGVTG